MCDKLIIIGAGVDHTKGIDFPLASSLLLEIVDYLKSNGQVQGFVGHIFLGICGTVVAML
jgi:hypothetical protein